MGSPSSCPCAGWMASRGHEPEPPEEEGLLVVSPNIAGAGATPPTGMVVTVGADRPCCVSALHVLFQRMPSITPRGPGYLDYSPLLHMRKLRHRLVT